MNTKAGYVSIIGKPNVGKSSFLNAILGQKLSITTPKPQTTRKRILGILSEEAYQIVFFDTPGMLKPAYKLQEKMMDFVRISVNDADVLLVMFDLTDPGSITAALKDEDFLKELPKTNRPKYALLNKIDCVDQFTIERIKTAVEQSELFDKIFLTSCFNPDKTRKEKTFGIDAVLAAILERLPVHPKYYPDDIASDETERFFVSEFIREAIFEQYTQEIPYSCEVVIEDFKERKGSKDYIRAVIYVERDSQKGIMVGKKGAAMKTLGEASRKAVEDFLERPVFLDLHVKVREKWRSEDKFLTSFGYDITNSTE